MPKSNSSKICIAEITAPHGVRGLVKVRSFTDSPAAFQDYTPVTDESGERVFDLEIVSQKKGFFLVRVRGVKGRDSAEALRQTKLYIDRSQLPTLEKEQFYYTDLIGMTAITSDKTVLGIVCAVQNFGAGDLLEIEQDTRFFVPFTKAAIPDICFKTNTIVIADEFLLDR